MAFVAPLALAIGAGGGAAALGGTLATSLAVAGAAYTGISGFQQAQYQKAIAQNNADIAKQNADRAAYAAQIQQQRSDVQYADLKGQQFAAQGASGLDILGRTQTQERGVTDIVRGQAAGDIRAQGDSTVRRYQMDQANFATEANMYGAQATDSLISGAFGVAKAVDGGTFNRKSLLGSSRSTRATAYSFGNA